MGGLFNTIETDLNNKLVIINGLIHYQNYKYGDLHNHINEEDIINLENGDSYNLYLNSLIMVFILNNKDLNHWGQYIKEEMFNLINGYYK